MGTSHPIDDGHIREGRHHIHKAKYGHPGIGKTLEIGPMQPVMGNAMWETLDITPGCNYQADITKRTPIEDDTYDVVLCLDVLEHTLQPFDALKEIRRITKPGGLLIASAPFNVRRHGPLPDCWRFGIDGWKVLLRDWDGVEIDVLESERFLCPIHINVQATCNKTKATKDEELEFKRI